MTADPTNVMTGRMLGDFVVHQQIGAGGFGAVYLAEQVSLGREAVIKIPLARADADAAFAAQFLREAQFASQLDHPYAAHIYAFGVEEDGTLWTAMELVRGTPLSELLKKHGPLPVDKFVPLFDKLCEVVHTAHEQGIIHRDLKPANVMVIARAGRLLPKLLDLGIAKLSGSSGIATGNGQDGSSRPLSETSIGGGSTHATAAVSDSQIAGVTESFGAQPTVGPGLTKLRALTVDASATPTNESDTIGTPAYMAPEQWVRSIPTDARTDVYALGILAYESLTGRLPFKGKNSMELARAHARATPPPLGGDLPPALDAVIAIALAKRPDKRYQTAVELAAAMRKATGFDQEPVKLPTLDAALREALLATAPQPLAEAVSALDSVRNAHQGLSAVFQIMRVTTRLLGNLSLSCWTHYGTLAERGHPEVARALGQLKRHGLDEMEWLDLAELIAVQFTDRRDSAPLPELIELFCPDTARTTSRTTDDASEGTAVSRAMRAIVATKDHYETALAPDAATTKRLLEETMPQLQVVLAGLAWLADYLLVVPRGEVADRWMGTRRQPRAVLPLQAGAEVTEGEPLLVTADGAPILRLSPFFQAAAPAPGQDAEMFVLDGSGRSGARLVSMPTGFEKSDHTLWGWLGTQVAIEALDSERKLNERAPYRGLAAFTADDADMFVGRERETESVANRLRITAMLGIVGPSGAGKSSFIQAGVLPALGSHWTSVIVRPGGSPLLALRTMVRGLEGLSETTDDALAGAGLGNVLRAWATERKQSLMLYVDQFEELFTLCHDVAERKAYVDMLLHASLSPADPLRVVFTVRDDFLLRCQQLEALRDRLVSGLQLLSTPTPDDLLRILIEPARRAGYEFDDPALPGEMVQAIADMPSALPLLSFTAAQLWELRDRQASKLARKAYESLGGVGGALAQHAERVLGGMSPEAQGLVRIVFRNLVTADGTRAILTRAEALEILGNHADAETTLEALIHARLLTASEGAGALDRIEVVHEALLSAWPRLINWRREDAEGARMRDQLRAAARQWDERGRPRGLLWRDETLTEYTLWRSRNPGNLTGVEAAFGAASIAEAARSRRLRRIAISTIFASLTIGMIVSLFMFRTAEKQKGRAQTNEARAKDLVRSGYLSRGQQAAVAGDTNAAAVYLAAALREGAKGSALAIPLGSVLRTIQSEKKTYRGHDGKVWALLTLPDSKHFASAGDDGTVNLWHIDQDKPRHSWHDAKAGIFNLEVSRDGRYLVAPSYDGHARVYDLEQGKLKFDLNASEGSLWSAHFANGGQDIIVLAMDGTASLWRLASGELLWRFVASPAEAGNPAISKNGSMFIVPAFDGNVYVWDLMRRKQVKLIKNAHRSQAWTASLSPDEKLVAIGAWDTNISVWDTTSWRQTAFLVGHSAGLERVAWSVDGTKLATGDREGGIRTWSRAGTPLKEFKSDRGSVFSIDWDEGAHSLLVGIGDSSITLDANSLLPSTQFQGQGPTIFRTARVDGLSGYLAAGSDGTIKLWQPNPQLRQHTASYATDFERITPCGRLGWFQLLAGRAELVSNEGKPIWQSPKTWAVDHIACSADANRRVALLADGAVWTSTDGKDDFQNHSTRTPKGDAVVISARTERFLVSDALGGLSIAALRSPGAPAIQIAPNVDGSGKTHQLFWAESADRVVRATKTSVQIWNTSTGELVATVVPAGGTVHSIYVDPEETSVFILTVSRVVQRFALTSGHAQPELKCLGFPTSIVATSEYVLVGTDDGSVHQYDKASGLELRLIGNFQTAVLNLALAEGVGIWIATMGRKLMLVEPATGAILAAALLTDEPLSMTPGQDASVAVAGGNSFVTLALQANALASPCVDAVVACLVPFRLIGGLLQPSPRSEPACHDRCTAPQ